jgi:hypothetical protein
MNLQQIKEAVEAGKTVHWSNRAYKVIKDSIGQWLIVCSINDHCIGLTWRDNITMNGREDEFYIQENT